MMNATKRKRRLAQGGVIANATNPNTGNSTVFSPDGKPLVTVRPDGVVVFHDRKCYDAAPFFLPPGTPVAFGEQLPDELASKEVQ